MLEPSFTQSLILLAAGGALTILGGWLNGLFDQRRQMRREEAQRSHEKETRRKIDAKAALDRAYGAAWKLWGSTNLEKESASDVARSYQFLELELIRPLLTNPELRELVFSASNSIVQWESFKKYPGRHEEDNEEFGAIMLALRDVLAAELRGDPIDPLLAKPLVDRDRWYSEKIDIHWNHDSETQCELCPIGPQGPI